ncbi:hypothetical protein KKE14_00215 [Patescibacteria group bacterium]|nr:hypothetical protein [Patescibacteria group bacterium]
MAKLRSDWPLFIDMLYAGRHPGGDQIDYKKDFLVVTVGDNVEPDIITSRSKNLSECDGVQLEVPYKGRFLEIDLVVDALNIAPTTTVLLCYRASRGTEKFPCMLARDIKHHSRRMHRKEKVNVLSLPLMEEVHV